MTPDQQLRSEIQRLVDGLSIINMKYVVTILHLLHTPYWGTFTIAVEEGTIVKGSKTETVKF